MSRPFILFNFLLLFTACSQESDLVSYQSNSGIEGPDRDAFHLILTETGNQRGDTCLELKTDVWLYKNWSQHPVSVYSPENTIGNPQLAKRFIIHSDGDAASDMFTRGNTTADLTYDIYRNGRHKLSGTLFTRFYFGEIIEMKLDGEAKMVTSGDDIYLVAIPTEAKFITEASEHELEGSQVILLMTYNDQSQLITDIQMNSILCIP